jgi:hypothetical protein
MAGFSLHARTVCEAYQRNRLKRLCRCITRPPVATKRSQGTSCASHKPYQSHPALPTWCSGSRPSKLTVSSPTGRFERFSSPGSLRMQWRFSACYRNSCFECREWRQSTLMRTQREIASIDWNQPDTDLLVVLLFHRAKRRRFDYHHDRTPS